MRKGEKRSCKKSLCNLHVLFLTVYLSFLYRGIDVTSMAQEARCKLQSLNNRLFEELCSDIYDEVDRRENDAGRVLNNFYLTQTRL